jgi:DNA-binding transcriptional LysR family regulator
MRNIPTDLLRALVTVIDLKGYGRAGELLGRAQPTISLQIKRLQEMLGVTLLEREGGLTRLTEAGEICSAYARRILALHDEMLHRLLAQGAGNRLRVGLPNDYADHFLPYFLAAVEAEGLSLRFEVISDISVHLLRDLREGTLDLVLAMTADAPHDGALHAWAEPLAWIGAPGRAPPAWGRNAAPLTLVAAPEGCIYRRAMLSALQRQGWAGDVVYTTPSLTGIVAGVRAGLGVSAMAARMVPAGLVAVDGLPELPAATVAIHLNPRAQGPQVRRLAALLARTLAGPAAGEAAASIGGRPG